MRLAVTGIDHQPLEVRSIDESLHQRFPYTAVAPAAEASMGIFPVAIYRRQIAPGRARSQNPKDGVKEAAVVLAHATPLT
jgi:hypothetical protein